MENFNSFKSVNTILIEAVVVGVGLVILYNIIDFLFAYFKYPVQQFVLLFLSGFLFHVLCEYTGVNVWYVKEYSKLIK